MNILIPIFFGSLFGLIIAYLIVIAICKIMEKKFASQKQDEINSQQIKKDDNLMGKSSGDTKMEGGSKNHLKDFQSDNQSADNLFANQKESEVKNE